MHEEVLITIQENPDIKEVKHLLVGAFNTLPEQDLERLNGEEDQGFDDWFSIEEMMNYTYGKLIEARNKEDILVGVAFVGKQNPISWPDGKKAELFIVGVDLKWRGQGLGRKLVTHAEKIAKQMSCEKLIVNTHVAMESDHAFYQKLGFSPMGILEKYYGNGNAIFFLKTL
ncbi:MAG TPA: GNAT family N-acetyltransferase [Candidatus Saccharimonadales bacterium]|nr:GNAT family N-acetyltransferase [Candidatus Saccharimonadales bacterium]